MDNYLVIEMQTNSDGSVASIKDAFTDRDLAEQKYHLSLSAAAVSSCSIHSVVMLDFTGRLIKRELYTHGEQEEPVEE